MVLLGLCDHAAANSSVTTHMFCSPHTHTLNGGEDRQISGTGPEQIWQTAMHNDNHRTLGGNDDIVWCPAMHHQCLEVIVCFSKMM
jgi:hypothetical protein